MRKKERKKERTEGESDVFVVILREKIKTRKKERKKESCDL